MHLSRFRPRLTIRRLIVIVALIALMLGGVRHKRIAEARAKLAMLKADLVRAEGRATWSREMRRQGYPNTGQAKKDQVMVFLIKAEIDELGGESLERNQ